MKITIHKFTIALLSLLAIGALCVPHSAIAQSDHWTSHSALFGESELSLDLSSTYTVDKAKLNDAFDKGSKHGDLGYSLGVTKFFNRYAGVGLDVGVRDADDTSNGLIDQANITGTLRFPIGHTAPFLSASFGRNFDAGDYTCGVGAGAEYRITSHAGIVGEARYTWARHVTSDTLKDNLQFRLGLRFVF